MRSLFFIFISILIPLTASANPEACTPDVKSCGYYLCVEKKHSCGPKGYPLGFGFRFCQVFLNSEHTYSPQGNEWLRQVRVCLMKALDEASDEKTCKAMRSKAFHQHVDCYKSTGFCDLRAFEQLRILWNLRQSFVQKEVIQDAYSVAKICASRRELNQEVPAEPR